MAQLDCMKHLDGYDEQVINKSDVDKLIGVWVALDQCPTGRFSKELASPSATATHGSSFLVFQGFDIPSQPRMTDNQSHHIVIVEVEVPMLAASSLEASFGNFVVLVNSLNAVYLEHTAPNFRSLGLAWNKVLQMPAHCRMALVGHNACYLHVRMIFV